MKYDGDALETLGLIRALLERHTLTSVRFDQAVEESIAARQGRRPRTLSEVRAVCGRLMRLEPGLAAQPVHSLGRETCARLVQFGSTPRQQHKFRVILHGVMEYCRRRQWCISNPVALLQSPFLVEEPIHPLSWEALKRLLKLARDPQHRACMPPLGLMLWAGIRPAEVTRLRWQDIDWEESVISLRPVHSKTGGCRHVQLQPVLRRWLRQAEEGRGLICPPNWPRRWRALRDAAGLIPWRQDVLRHTFASYHAKHFHDFPRLQEDMGHRSAALLRTRYLSMQGITAALARRFWTPGEL